MYYSYKKAFDQYTVYHMLFSYSEDDTAQPFELGTIDGITYVAVPDGYVLPPQPKQIADSIKEVSPDSEIIAKLADAFPVINLTKRRMAGLEPAVRYSKQDELTLKMIVDVVEPVVSVLDAKTVVMTEYVDVCRAWDKTVLEPVEVEKMR
ncbi:MAG: hypothetical protein WDA41_11315 [Candidatus Neomarinimicrobiota bacterium]